MIEIAALATSALSAALPYLKDMATGAVDSLTSGATDALKKKIAALFLKKGGPEIQEKVKAMAINPSAKEQQQLQEHLEAQLANDSDFKAELIALIKDLPGNNQLTVTQNFHKKVDKAITVHTVNGDFNVS